MQGNGFRAVSSFWHAFHSGLNKQVVQDVTADMSDVLEGFSWDLCHQK